jgi:ATP-binding cassette subfamily B (MDR/TAP) protein 1
MADGRSSVHSSETLRDAEHQVQHVQMEETLRDAENQIQTVQMVTLENPYAHLPPHQAQILEQQVSTEDIKKGAGILYRYASRNDLLILFISSVTAIGAGAAFPLMTIVFGKLQGVFERYLTGGSDYGQFKHEMDHYVLYFIYLAIGEFFATYICTVGFIYAGEHISGKIRAKYLESCVYQNIGFFDKTSAGEVTTRITSDTNLIQDGISEKMSLTISALATFFVAFIIGYIYYWKLTLILTGTIFALIINSIIGSGFMGKNSKQALDSYALGGSLADEVFSSVRNAIAFGTQNRLANQYGKHLEKAEYFGIRYKAALAFMVAGMMLITYLNYGLAFWQGSKFLIEGVVPLSKVLTIMMCVMIGSFQLGNVAPNLQAFGTAVAASVNIFTTIDRVSPINSSNEEGDKLTHIEGNIRLENVQHIYPSRPDVLVMQDMTLNIPAGKTTALVGASGSGKSTIIGLVERFYNPVEGTIYLDGHDITGLNLRWLRQQMALVSQEPTLFSTTIFENIANGLTGVEACDLSKEAKRELIVNAARMANAHDFIVNLPEGYETNVGEGGFLLSGGQKQRIVIARAVISDPKSMYTTRMVCTSLSLSFFLLINTVFHLSSSSP